MSLSNNLISQFVKTTKDDKKNQNDNIIYGTVVEYKNEKYVKFDGSELLTPISSTTNIDDGERVTVMVKNHTATVIGNISSPSAKDSDVKEIGNKISGFEIVIADKVSTKEFDAEKARIDDLVAENVTIKGTLTATEADIKYIKADNVTINEKLSANEAEIKQLSTEKLDADVADITYATIGDLEVTNGNIYNLRGTYAKFEETTTNSLEAINANIANLKADKLDVEDADIKYATIENLNSANANINKLNSDYANFKNATANNFSAINGKIETLETNQLTTEQLDAKYANIEFTNINEASIENLFTQSGMIKDLVMSSGSVTGELVGVTIKGDLIEANTIVADKLIIQGSDGLYYKLNTNGVTVESQQTNYNSINGSIITAKSITATKIKVDDLKAFNATIGGFKITDNSIYSGSKSAIDNTTRGIYFDTDGQMVFGDSTNYIKFYKDTNDSIYKLNISVSSMLIGNDGKNVEMIIDDMSSEMTDGFNDISSTITEVSNIAKEYTDSQIVDCVKSSELESINNSIDDRIEEAKSDVLNDISNNYVVVSEVDKIYETVRSMIQKSDQDITFTFQGIKSEIQNEIKVNQQNFEKYIRFSESGIELGELDSPFKTNITNTDIYFSQSGKKIAYISNSKLYILEAEFINKMSIGSDSVGYYDWVIRKNGHLSLKLRGGVS